MIDLGFIKPAAIVLARILPSFRRLTAERRVARDPQEAQPDHSDKIFEDALRHLGAVNQDDSKLKKVVSSTISWIIRPAHFRKPHIKDWLSQASTKRDLKVLAKGALTGEEENGDARTRLISTYLDSSNEDKRCAESVIQIAVTVLRTRLDATAQDPAIAAYVQEGIASVHRRFDTMGLPPLVPPSRGATTPLDVGAHIDVSDVRRAFGEASRLLLGWPQDTDGHWIDRPELDQLHSRATQEEPALTVLLGRPGAGKSAILARLGARLKEEGNILLAIKADQIPSGCTTLADIDAWVGCDDVTNALRQLSETRSVVVLIDQLDALADLMDQHSNRLTALLQLVGSIRGTPNLQVILSCREFEFRNDVRLSTLGAVAVTLEPPPWELVAPLLGRYGVSVEQFGKEQREVLRTPQHLAVFVHYFVKRDRHPAFSTYQALLDHAIREDIEGVYGRRTASAAERVAIEMASDEELWIARGRFTAEYDDELKNLLAAGFLVESENGLSIAFRHQTVFDFLRARAFMGGGRNLAEYVLTEKQESLFVRPILWSALSYLRESDRAVYRRELDRLWSHNELRLHLRLLLAAFLGQLPDPDEVEAAWLLPKLDDAEFQRRILLAMAGSPGWFRRIRARLPGLMTLGRTQASNLTPLLGRAMAFAPDDVLALVEKHWMTRDEYSSLVYWLLYDLTSWDRKNLDLAVRFAAQVAQGSSGENANTFRIAKRIAEHRPQMAPAVLFSYLQARADRMFTGDRSGGQPMDSEIARLFGNRSDWYGVDELADKAPKEFVRQGWSWLTEIFERLARDPNHVVVEYRGCHHFPSWSDNDETLWSAFEAAMRGFAETAPDEFLRFVDENEQSDLMLKHHLLALGLERIAPEDPQAVVDYLLGDARRFAIGDFTNRHRLSQGLITAVVPKAANPDVSRLELAIMDWRYYRDLNGDPELRFRRMKWTRESRMKLLRCFPSEKLSAETRAYLREEERALPHVKDEEIGPVQGGIVGSPMTAQQMAAAADDHIINLFSELTDDTEWSHPMRGMDLVGGSIEASRAFAEFAVDNPDRAFRIIDSFRAGDQERPAGYALEKLGDSSISPDILIDCVRRLHARGFASEHFRNDAARCLREVAHRNAGLDDNTCTLLESWITDITPEEQHPASDTLTDVDRTDEGTTEAMQHSLLWHAGGIQFLPNGNYPVLEALALGYLNRDPMDADGWLDTLTRHIAREEADEVWVAITRYLPYLEKADRPSSVAFLRQLLDAHPDVLLCQRGVRMVYRVLGWLPDSMIDRIIDTWATGSWPQGPQAAGEVAMVPHLRDPEQRVARERVERMLDGAAYEADTLEGLYIGFAHTLTVAWRETELRPLATPLLIRLMSLRSENLSQAVSRLFLGKDSLPPDQYTEQILQACLDHPHILVTARDSFLVDRLRELLANGWNPLLVHAVANRYLECSSQQESRNGRKMRAHADLVELALTLHRLPETRTHGLDLFENLLVLGAYDAEERLKTLDRRAR